jgi:photosystem II stability/assembly factor-like uncharacterized protein
LPFSFLLKSQDGFKLEQFNITVNSSFRGLSVVNDSIAWVSGSNGYVGTLNADNNSWKFFQPTGFEKSDFRSVYAFDEKSLVIANAGSPAYILYTSDNALSWKVVYENKHPDAFIDGIDFWNENDGIAYGDPINRKMLLLFTADGGKTWQEFPDSLRPVLSDGEASFAASGTAIRCINDSKVVIATGGKKSRLWISENKGNTWSTIDVPVIQGEGTQGIFSFTFINDKHAILVGGDYKQDTLKNKHVLYTSDGGLTWKYPVIPTGGYRECIERINENAFIAAGPAGIDISFDKGLSWKPLSSEKLFHVVRKARKGSLVLLAGGNGKIAFIAKEE